MALYNDGATSHRSTPNMGGGILSGEVRHDFVHYAQPRQYTYEVQSGDSDSKIAMIVYGADTPHTRRMVRVQPHHPGAVMNIRSTQ